MHRIPVQALGGNLISGQTRVGSQVLRDAAGEAWGPLLRGKRVAVLTNPSGVFPDTFQHLVDALHDASQLPQDGMVFGERMGEGRKGQDEEEEEEEAAKRDDAHGKRNVLQPPSAWNGNRREKGNEGPPVVAAVLAPEHGFRGDRQAETGDPDHYVDR